MCHCYFVFSSYLCSKDRCYNSDNDKLRWGDYRFLDQCLLKGCVLNRMVGVQLNNKISNGNTGIC